MDDFFSSFGLSDIIVALIASLPTLYVVLRQAKKERAEVEKTKADTANVLTETAKSLMQEIRQEMVEYKNKIRVMEKMLVVYTQVIKILLAQLETNNLVPEITEDELENLLSEADKDSIVS